MESTIKKIYGNTVRVRVCGLCWRGPNLLLANHLGLGPGDFWAPPGGGLELFESAEARLKKEYAEETGLDISMGPFRFACEFIRNPLHAVELFFDVDIIGGQLMKGDDPEIAIIQDVRFMSPADLETIPAVNKHGIFGIVHSSEDLKTLSGFFTI